MSGSEAWFSLRHKDKHKHKHKHKHNECSHLLHKHKESGTRKHNELQNEAVGESDEARSQYGGGRNSPAAFERFCCSADARYLFTHNFLIKAAFISETCECSLTIVLTQKVFYL